MDTEKIFQLNNFSKVDTYLCRVEPLPQDHVQGMQDSSGGMVLDAEEHGGSEADAGGVKVSVP